MLEFAKSFYNKAPNLTAEALKKLFGRFGAVEAAKLEAFLTRPRHEALSDLMSIRNPVAHGEVFEGAKLDPTRYMELCMDFYDWCVAEYLTAI